jgi:hypothetical protein
LQYLSYVHSLEEAAGLLFPDHVLADPSQSIRHSFLSLLNLRVDEFNQLLIDCLPGTADKVFTIIPLRLQLTLSTETYLSCDSVKEVKDTVHHFPPALYSKYLAILSEPGVLLYKLHLKVGTIYSIICNLYIEKGLVKNVRIQVVELHRYIVRVELLYNQSVSNDN